MKDTTFVPSDDRKSRIVSLYGRSPEGVLTQAGDAGLARDEDLLLGRRRPLVHA